MTIIDDAKFEFAAKRLDDFVCEVIETASSLNDPVNHIDADSLASVIRAVLLSLADKAADQRNALLHAAITFEGEEPTK